jgi:hypothetical protein
MLRTINIKDDHHNFTLAYSSGLPYVKRVDKDMAVEKGKKTQS